MQLKGSCHCGAVKFRLESPHPTPYMLCYCSICRKTQGGGGYGLNISGDHDTLSVQGEENIAVYRATLESGETSTSERHFCRICGSGLWSWNPDWPELNHPYASAIDSELPVAPEYTHIMLASKASWVPVHAGPSDKQFDEYPKESIADWHKRLSLEC